jgi:hypothetical protein
MVSSILTRPGKKLTRCDQFSVSLLEPQTASHCQAFALSGKFDSDYNGTMLATLANGKTVNLTATGTYHAMGWVDTQVFCTLMDLKDVPKNVDLETHTVSPPSGAAATAAAPVATVGTAPPVPVGPAPTTPPNATFLGSPVHVNSTTFGFWQSATGVPPVAMNPQQSLGQSSITPLTPKQWQSQAPATPLVPKQWVTSTAVPALPSSTATKREASYSQYLERRNGSRTIRRRRGMASFG